MSPLGKTRYLRKCDIERRFVMTARGQPTNFADFRISIGNPNRYDETKSEFGGSYSKNDSVTYRFSGDLEVDVDRGPLAGRVAGEFGGTAIHALAFAYNKRF